MKACFARNVAPFILTLVTFPAGTPGLRGRGYRSGLFSCGSFRPWPVLAGVLCLGNEIIVLRSGSFSVLRLFRHVVKWAFDATLEFFHKRKYFVLVGSSLGFQKWKVFLCIFILLLKASGITLGLTSVQTFPLVTISPVSGPEQASCWWLFSSLCLCPHQWQGPTWAPSASSPTVCRPAGLCSRATFTSVKFNS